MECPHCGSKKTEVYKTEKYPHTIMRIRGCKVCNKSFKTHEEPQEPQKSTEK